WKSDGTEAGTVLGRDRGPVASSSRPGQLTNVGGTLFFTADTGTHPGAVYEELWKSDGTEAGTVRVAFVDSGPGLWLLSLTNVNGTLFFSSIIPPDLLLDAPKLWKSDGTGTELLKDFGTPFPILSYVLTALTNFGGTLYFSAFDTAAG